MHQRESFKRNYKIGALKGNENITYQNLWDVAKVIFQGKFTVINTYISKGKRSQFNKVSTSRKQNKEAQNKPRASRRKEIIIRRTQLSDFTFTHWRRKWQPTPVFLLGESQGWRSLVGCCLWGHTESDTTEAT